MTIFSNTLKRIFRKRVNILFMLIVPILLNMFLISVSTKEVTYNVGILDQDATPFTQQLVSHMKKQYNVTMLTPSDDIKSMVVNKKVDGAYAIPKGFTTGMLDGKDVSVQSYALANTNVNQPVQVNISSYIAAAKQIAKAAKGNSNTFYQGMDAYNKKLFAADYKNFSETSAKDISNAVSSLGYIAFGMMFLLAFSSGLMLEDKLSGVYDRIMATPLKRSSYFLQHLLASFVIAAIQIVILISELPKLVNISYGSTSDQQQQVIIVCCVFALACVSIGVFISRFSKTALMASALTTLVNIPMLMLGGCFWPREIMPSYVQHIGDFMPTTWFLQAGESVLYGKGLASAGNQLLYLLSFAAVLLIVSFGIKSEKVR